MKARFFILVIVLFTFENCTTNKNTNNIAEVSPQIKMKSELFESSVDENVDLQNDTIKFQIESLNHDFKFATHYKLDKNITIDLNGDNFIDTATFIKKDNKAGIIIIDGKTNEKTTIGLGIAFEEMSDNFGWVDYWGVVKDKTTYEIIITEKEGIIGDTIVNLENPSIVLRKEEVGGGLITFKNGKFIWIHQSD